MYGTLTFRMRKTMEKFIQDSISIMIIIVTYYKDMNSFGHVVIRAILGGCNPSPPFS